MCSMSVRHYSEHGQNSSSEEHDGFLFHLGVIDVPVTQSPPCNLPINLQLSLTALCPMCPTELTAQTQSSALHLNVLGNRIMLSDLLHPQTFKFIPNMQI